jgi:NAD(P)-dependent dehydrogenase (short-subunit alcohol dehydrogenase family)
VVGRPQVSPYHRFRDAEGLGLRCVITGAADGIGRALAERFGRADYAVTGVDVDEQRSKQTRDELKALGIDIRFVIRDS